MKIELDRDSMIDAVAENMKEDIVDILERIEEGRAGKELHRELAALYGRILVLDDYTLESEYEEFMEPLRDRVYSQLEPFLKLSKPEEEPGEEAEFVVRIRVSVDEPSS